MGISKLVWFPLETDKALYMSLAMVCKNEALDVVKKGDSQAWL